MTDQERFVHAIERELEGITYIAPGCAAEVCSECNPEWCDSEGNCEHAGFSWSACDSCGSSLGGTREPAHGWYKGEIVHLDICVDCLFFFANGDLPETWEDGR